MPLEYTSWLDRRDLRANPTKLYVFGDNVERTGMGGQAAACRGEPNALGIATKWSPSMSATAFFDDHDEVAAHIIDSDLNRVRDALAQGRTVVVPQDGVGTGFSQMQTRCPWLLARINTVLFPPADNSGVTD